MRKCHKVEKPLFQIVYESAFVIHLIKSLTIKGMLKIPTAKFTRQSHLIWISQNLIKIKIFNLSDILSAKFWDHHFGVWNFCVFLTFVWFLKRIPETKNSFFYYLNEKKFIALSLKSRRSLSGTKFLSDKIVTSQISMHTNIYWGPPEESHTVCVPISKWEFNKKKLVSLRYTTKMTHKIKTYFQVFNIYAFPLLIHCLQKKSFCPTFLLGCAFDLHFQWNFPSPIHKIVKMSLIMYLKINNNNK